MAANCAGFCSILMQVGVNRFSDGGFLIDGASAEANDLIDHAGIA